MSHIFYLGPHSVALFRHPVRSVLYLHCIDFIQRSFGRDSILNIFLYRAPYQDHLLYRDPVLDCNNNRIEK